MTGVELLVDRAQLWEQSAAKHVSIAGTAQYITLALKFAMYVRFWSDTILLFHHPSQGK